MACNTASKKISVTGTRAGVTAMSSNLSYATGILTAQAAGLSTRLDRTLDRTGQAAAPTAQVLLAATNELQTNKTARRVGTAAALAAGLLLPPIRTARRVVQRVDQVTSLVGDVAGAVSQTEPAGEVWQEKRSLFFFKSRTPVTIWRSRLTGMLNRKDLPGMRGLSGKDVVSSEGVMFRAGDKTWHRGTLVVDTGQGRRTVTHLQSLSLPGTHYYFNQPLTDEQAVGLAADQPRPETIPGLAGQVSSTEALCPGWAELKHSLIKTRLYWGASGNERQE